MGDNGMVSNDVTGKRPAAQIAVVTVTYNGEGVLPEFLESIAATRADVQLIVVDNNSDDNSVGLVKKARLWRKPIVIENRTNVGVAIANNQGIRVARDLSSDWVLLLNNDTVFDSEYISGLLRVAASNAGAFVTSLIESSDPRNTVWFSDGRIREWAGLKVEHPGRGGSISGHRRHSTVNVNYAPTCSLLGRTDDFFAVGLMDEDYFVYYDDVDFCVRARRLGYRYLMTAEVVLLHKESSSTGGTRSEFSIRWESKNRAVAIRKLQAPGARVLSAIFVLSWVLARLVTGRDTFRTTLRRLGALWEGSRLPLVNSVPGQRRSLGGGRS